MSHTFLEMFRSIQKQSAIFDAIESAEPETRTPAGFAAEEAGRSIATVKSLVTAPAKSTQTAPAIWPIKRGAPSVPPGAAPDDQTHDDQASQLRRDVAAANLQPQTTPTETPTPPAAISVIATPIQPVGNDTATDESDQHSLTRILGRVEQLDSSASLETVQHYIVLRDWIMECAKSIDKTVKERVLDWIQINKQEVTLGPVRYYARFPKTTECTDQPSAVNAILEENGGDVAVLIECLGAGAIKHGAAEQRLQPATFAKFFKVERKPVLKEGKPAKQLCKTDERFTN